MLTVMKLRTPRTPPTPLFAGTGGCSSCAGELAHCHETLVVHADGSAECEGYPACGLDPTGHDLWMACAELDGCGCTGDDADLAGGLPLAA